MGRKWANIVAKKTAKDANNSRVYAKFGIEIYAAAKSGDPDPHANQKLRFVIERAKHTMYQNTSLTEQLKAKVQGMNNTPNCVMKGSDQMVQWLSSIH